MKAIAAIALLQNVRSFIAVEYSEEQAEEAIGSLSFATFGKGSRAAKGKKPNCTWGKSWSCGYTCLPLSKTNCGSPLPGQASTYADYLSKQASRSKTPNEPKNIGDKTSNQSQENDKELDKKFRKTGIDQKTLQEAQDAISKKKAGQALTQEEDDQIKALTAKLKENQSKVFLEDGSELDLPKTIAYKLEDGSAVPRLKGNRVVSEQELKLAGIADANNLTKADLDRINRLRNGSDSYEDFLGSPPDFDGKNETNDIGGKKFKTDYVTNDVVIYHSDRVVLLVMNDGAVDFKVDGKMDASQRSTTDIPSSDLREMARAWNSFIDSPAGKRKMWTTPVYGDGRGDTRTKLYKKRGFDVTFDNQDPNDKNRLILMELNNRD